jgi:uncharacterized protein (DUF1778 family)
MDWIVGKEGRIEIRLDEADKQLFRRAQQIVGDASISSFITRIVKERSLNILREHDAILVSEEDREVFFEACLAASPSPSAELLKAAARHKEVIQRAD